MKTKKTLSTKKPKSVKSIEEFNINYFPKSTYEELFRRVASLEIEVAMLKARPFSYPINPFYPWDIRYVYSTNILTPIKQPTEEQGEWKKK